MKDGDESLEDQVRRLAPQYAENVEPEGWLVIHIDHIAAMVRQLLEGDKS